MLSLTAAPTPIGLAHMNGITDTMFEPHASV